MGLVEGEWIQTLAAVDPATLDYRDFVAEGRRLAGELKVGAWAPGLGAWPGGQGRRQSSIAQRTRATAAAPRTPSQPASQPARRPPGRLLPSRRRRAPSWWWR
jgi:hypothetical protein